jgi:hypothetical protein
VLLPSFDRDVCVAETVRRQIARPFGRPSAKEEAVIRTRFEIYFGVVRSHRVLGLTMLVVLVGLVIRTAPNRWGAGIALHYLSRVYWPDPADAIPPPPATRPRG